jgi:hypothetical protein
VGCAVHLHLGHGGDIGYRYRYKLFHKSMMENDNELDALADIRKHFRTVSFTPATEFISIDLRNKPVPKESRNKERAAHDSVRCYLAVLCLNSMSPYLFYFKFLRSTDVI